jgi:hypothetical protein
MSLSQLIIRTAQKHVKNYEAETAVMMAHYQAMECLDCEAYLDLGIDAFGWIIKATKDVRKSALKSDDDGIDEAEKLLRMLRKIWLGPCDWAEQWAELQIQRGFALPNLEKFRQCSKAMRQLVESDENREQCASLAPSAEILSKIAIDPPPEWINEPAW